MFKCYMQFCMFYLQLLLLSDISYPGQSKTRAISRLLSEKHDPMFFSLFYSQKRLSQIQGISPQIWYCLLLKKKPVKVLQNICFYGLSSTDVPLRRWKKINYPEEQRFFPVWLLAFTKSFASLSVAQLACARRLFRNTKSCARAKPASRIEVD